MRWTSTLKNSSLELPRPLDLVILGSPGVGKGTYGALIGKWLEILHLSSGDLIRAEIASQSKLGLEVEPQINRGELLSDELVMQLVKSRLKKPDASNGTLFDGFPRRGSQVPMLDNVRSIKAAIMLTLREDVLYEKAINRRVCSTCKRSYNTAHIMEGSMRMPAILPKVGMLCDSCGGTLEHRSDDQPETVKARLELAKTLNKEVSDAYQQTHRLFEFQLTSGVADMWPKLKDYIKSSVITRRNEPRDL
ncbi:hypothetical protein NDN08_006904 [Rhodosorus marinus]|uniref:Adenylate kinase active site lid domain-containing protein n=1 Tax=Rhodosorus marinus TaxID=101924 RepID=A0AAV8UPG1_9RHOD|nr:hypothetical protein NDN08_006904 [Rhodosorus marinus]